MVNIAKPGNKEINNFIIQNLYTKNSNLDKYQFFKVLQTIWPNIYEVDYQNSKNFSQQTAAYKFGNDVAIMFGSHSSSLISKSEDNLCSIVFPIKGRHTLIESENNFETNSENNEGFYLCGADVRSLTSNIEALAVGFNPSKLEQMMKHFACNKNIKLPQYSKRINFNSPQIADLKKTFFQSINAAGSFGAFDHVTADMILRHCALILLSSMNEKIKVTAFVNNSQIIDKLCSKLYSNISEPYTLTFMERFSGLSGRVLQKEFNKRYGMSPFAWLNHQRLNRAKEILINPNNKKTVSEVSRDCGFTHLGRFSVNFRNKFGASAKSFKIKV